MRGSFRIAVEMFEKKEGIKCVEVGVAYGANAVHMLNGLPLAQFYLVDSYDPGHPTFQDQRPEGVHIKGADERETFIANVRKELEPFGERASLIIKDSVEASKDYPDEYFDYIYIDGDHDYQSVKNDLEAWWPKVKKGGLFGGHDFGVQVRDAVLEKFGSVSSGEESDWWLVKE